MLFFGRRYLEKDFSYRGELERRVKQRVIEVILSFSKPGSGQDGKYVTNALLERREQLWNLLCNDGHVYVCGSAAKVGRSAVVLERV